MQFPNSIVHIALPGIDVYLTSFFWGSILDRPRRSHSHISYELVCIESESGMRFIINPPLYDHMNADAPPETVKSFLFSLTENDGGIICETFANLKEPIEITDNFDGYERIKSLKKTISEAGFGVKEKTSAELWLLFVGLARAIHSSGDAPEQFPAQTIDEERIARINDFFHIHLSDPNCYKVQLADYIGVSERQLSRILKDIYGMGFSDILNSMRMNIAEAMREEGRAIDDIIKVTGFSSQRAFKYVYNNYWQRSFKSKM